MFTRGVHRTLTVAFPSRDREEAVTKCLQVNLQVPRYLGLFSASSICSSSMIISLVE
jgi:hypothetical protein